ncbi:unnamed protein product [Rotaria sordida]|uniref:Methyltransferase FkbM domain-containing protein n=1 Tax=Rotaria sordida TaxID=392033 RepID=A0A815RXF1_9BILA|nr:unnamed protein product [Rotaria sordida]CAF1483930.1 unnamed protein product [Rotaria sordida]
MMVSRTLSQSRYFLILFALIPLLLSIMHYYKKSNLLNNIFPYHNRDNILIKIFEINDRLPTYKLVTYQGYEFPLKRNRAQTVLINHLKLQEKCQQNPNTTVFDIGASLGEFGLYAAACGCQVYMFEIEPRKLSLIEKSITINKFESRVHLMKKAVSDLKSNTTVYFSKNSTSQLSSINHHKNQDIYRGETINLNDYPFSSSIYLFRVDVQGHELHVFRSTEKLFRRHLINHVIFEYTSWGTPKTVHQDIFQYMKLILGAKTFYALHPKEPIIYGPLNDNDLNEFYSQHHQQHLQRDVYALFKDEQLSISASPYNFSSSFK